MRDNASGSRPSSLAPLCGARTIEAAWSRPTGYLGPAPGARSVKYNNVIEEFEWYARPTKPLRFPPKI